MSRIQGRSQNTEPLFEYIEPEITFADLVLPDHVEESLSQFMKEFQYRKLLEEFGLKHRSRLMIEGPPGCGKTSIAHAMAHKIRRKVGYVHTERIISSYLGETGKAIDKMFRDLGSRNCVLLLDEVDTVASHRSYVGGHGASNEMSRATNALLRALDSYKGNSMIIGSTNMASSIDRAFWRRFDDVITMEAPTLEAYEELIDKRMEGYTMSEEVRDELIDVVSMNNLSMADADRLCSDVKKNVIMAAKPKSAVEDVSTVVEMDYLEGASMRVHMRQRVLNNLH